MTTLIVVLGVIALPWVAAFVVACLRQPMRFAFPCSPP